MAQPIPRLNIAHEVNPFKAFVPSAPWVLDKVLPVDATILTGTLKAGMAVSPSATNTWLLGVPAPTAAVVNVPYIAFQNDDDFDVVGQIGNIVGVQTNTANGLPIAAGGVNGISCAAGYELETTAFTGTPITGNPLTSAAVGPTAGLLAATTIVPGTPNTILGVVTDGIINSEFTGINPAAPQRLRFVTHLQFVL